MDVDNKSRFRPVKDRTWDSGSEEDDRGRDSIRVSSKMTPFILDCFYIDYDGHRLGPRPKRFVIPAYRGTRPIVSLDIYPATFDPDYEGLHQLLVERGKRFTTIAGGTHRRYSGITIREAKRKREGSYYLKENFEMHEEEVYFCVRQPYPAFFC